MCFLFATRPGCNAWTFRRGAIELHELCIYVSTKGAFDRLVRLT